MVDDPATVIDFFHKLREDVGKGFAPKLDLSKVRRMGSDAIAILMAHLRGGALAHVPVQGNLPADEEVLAKLYSSGFFGVVGVSLKVPPSPDAMIVSWGRQVLTENIEAVTDFAISKSRPGNDDTDLRDAIYSAVGECMHNTWDHARYEEEIQRKLDRRQWLLHAHFDRFTKITCITFVDIGVGIIKSIKLRDIAHTVMRTFGWENESDILRKILLGQIPSRTGDPMRGNGLPSIHTHYKNGFIKRLIVIANHAFIDFDRGVAQDLHDHFGGTFIYWEIHPEEGENV
jgi:hypothetical protein